MNGLSLRISGGGINKDTKLNHENKLQAFVFSEPFSVRYSSVANILGLLNARNVNEQLEFLRNIAKILDSSSENVNNVVSLLVNIFLEAPVKHPLKNTTARILSTKKLHQASIEDELSKELLKTISNLCTSKEFHEFNNVNTILNSCFDNFTPGVGAVKQSARKILPFLKNSLGKYVEVLRNDLTKLSPTEKLELYTYIHNLNRVLLTIIQKCDIDFYSVDCIEVWAELSRSFSYLIKHGDLPIDTNILCSMIFITICQLRYGSNAWKYILEIIFNVDDHSDHLMYEDVEGLNSPIEVLSICSSLLNIIDPEDLHHESIKGAPLLTFMTEKLFELSERMSVDTTIIIGVARAILSVSRLLFKITEDLCVITDVTKIILSFIWSHLEYYVDSVRHLSTQILVNVVKISVQLENQGNSKLSNEVFTSVMMLPPDRHSKYKGLATLSSEYGCKRLLHKYPNIVDDLLKAINNVTIPANVAVAFETLMVEHNKEVTIDVLFGTWIKPVMEAMMSYANNDETAVLSMNVLQEVLSKGIKLNPNLVSYMIPYIMNNQESNGKLSDGQLKCILVCLHVARKAGSFDQNVDDTSKHKWKNIIEYEIIRNGITHQLSEIRLLSFHLIVDTRKTTEMFTPEEFHLIEMFFHFNINVQSPSIRQNILALTKKMLKRWKDSFDVLLRSMDNTLKKSMKALHLNESLTCQKSDTDLLNSQSDLKMLYISFIEKLWRFCLGNIFPGANFSRRNISLQTLVWCQDFVKSEHLKFDWNAKAVTALVDYLDDSYECNKQLVVDLLSQCPVNYLQFHDQDFMKTFLNDTILKASSVKPTDCVTSAYKLSLLLKFREQFHNILCKPSFDLCGFDVHYHTLALLMDKLSSEMKVAESNILLAASNGPMYGLLHCIRHILNQVNFRDISENPRWSSLLYDLVQMSFKVNNIVAPIVNNSSPEGHLPMDFNAGSSHVEGNGVILEDGKRVTAQMVLLCAWRSVKEVSLLLGDISYNVEVVDRPTVENTGNTISAELILEIGDHFTTLLSETKHRGAFEQAYLGFSKLCLRLWKSTTESLHSLPGVWLQDLIAAISGNSENSKLCATRRSAGVPFMVQALVTTELQVSGNPQCFRNCITTLLKLAAFDDKTENDKTSVETRTHCLNILRALYRHTALGEHVNPYVAEGLMTAITGFDGSTWAERNSSTLLFSSLMTRIFGVQRSKDSDSLCIRNRMTGRIFFLRYPQLYDFILSHLRNVAEHIDGEDFLKPSLYPILLLLARLYPSSLEGTDSNLKLVAYIPYLLACAKCCVLKTRQLAAKAMVPLISHDRYFSHMMSLLDILTDKSMRTNHCHGILLQLIRLLQSPPDMCNVPDDFHQQLLAYLDKTKWIYLNIYTERPCFVTAESYLYMVYLCVIRFGIKVESNFFNEIYNDLKLPIDKKLRIHFGKEKFCLTRLHLSMQLAYERRDPEEMFHVLNDLKNSPIYEVQSTALNYILCLQSKSELKSVCEQFEISDVEQLFVTKLPNDMRNEIVELLDSSDKSGFNTNVCHENLQCYQKQLMSITYNKDLSESYWNLSPAKGTSKDERLYYFVQQTHALQNHQLDRFIYLRYLDNHFKHTQCTSIYDCYSEDAVKYLSRNMYESWTSFDNSVYMNLECVKFFKNHWRMFNWDKDLDKKERVYSILLQISSLLQLLDNEDEVVRQAACRVVADIATQNQATILSDYSVCENKAKEILLEHIVSWSKAISMEFFAFVLTVLALLDDVSPPADTTNDEEYQVFDKEVTTYQEKVANAKLCANFINKNSGEQWTLKNSKEKRLYLLNIIKSQCKGVSIGKEDVCQTGHSTFCLLWKMLASEESSSRNNVSHDVTSLNRITAFLDELAIDMNIAENCNECEDHVYQFMELK